MKSETRFRGVLADVCASIDYGFTASATETPTGPKFLRITDIVPGHIDWHGVPYVAANGAITEKYHLESGDIVIARTGATTGVSMYIDSPPVAVFASYLVRFKIKPEFDARFIAYWLKTNAFWNYLKGCLGDKSAQPNASASTMTSAPIEIPSNTGIQSRITNVLKSLDDRIDHNRALAANLEAIARRLFKSWFVDFDPVRAKAAGEKPSGLADDIAALFTDRLVDSELGDAPDGWKVGKISNFSTNVRIGCAPSQFSSEDFYVGLEHFDRRCLTLWNGGSGDDATSNKNRFSKGDLLFGKLRPYFHKVAIAPVDGICSTDILVIRCADSVYREFMYFSLFQDEVIQFVSDASGGTRMPRTNWETLAGYNCVVPPQPVACAFGEIVAPMIETMMQCVFENDALTKIRDLLLPRLISGKLRVSDAETFIEEAIA